MKVLLIRPPLTFTNPYQIENMAVGLPLGLLYVAAALEKENIQVSIFDGLVNFDLSSKRSFHFGASWEDIKKHIKEEKPDIVGITNHFTEEAGVAFKAARLAKEIDSGILTMLGGPFASTCPAEILEKEHALDMVIMGEGEITVPQAVRCIMEKRDLAKIEGLAFRLDDRVKVNKARPYIRDLDNLPFPAYHLVDMGRYFYFQEKGYSTRRQIVKSRKVPLITSRGCPFNCTFCCIYLHMGRVWRPHSPEYVLRHIGFLIESFNAGHILFEDDNINLDPLRFEKILDGISERGYKILWDTPNGIRADRLNERLIRKAKESGCLFLKIGVESGDQYVVNKIVKKHLDLNKVIETASLCKKFGVKLQAFFIIGFPGETKREINNTVNFSLMLFRKFKVISAIGPAKPLIGTALRKECVEKGYLTEPIETEDMRERLIARQEMIRTDAFALEYLFRVIKRYERRRRIITVEKTILLSLVKPRIFFAAIISLVARVIKRPSGFRRYLKESFNELRREFGLI